MHGVVRDCYGKTLQSSADLKTDACCDTGSMPARLKPLLARIHPEVQSRYYGCGRVCLPLPEERELQAGAADLVIDVPEEMTMARFASLPDSPGLADVFRRFPRGAWPLFEYHDALLRGASPFSVAERELIAAYVSGLNACGFCHGAHRAVAEVHGIDPLLIEALMADPQHSGMDAAWLPLLAYVKKLTEQPARLTDADAAAVYAAGWSEEALFDAIAVCALFNFMNRLVEGCGIAGSAASSAMARERHQALRDSATPYQAFGAAAAIPR